MLCVHCGKVYSLTMYQSLCFEVSWEAHAAVMLDTTADFPKSELSKLRTTKQTYQHIHIVTPTLILIQWILSISESHKEDLDKPMNGI